MSEYPEHDKLRAVADQSQAIGEFLDNSGYTLCKVEHRGKYDYRTKVYEYVATTKSITQILAEYFDIDLNKFDNENREIIRKEREKNEDS